MATSSQSKLPNPDVATISHLKRRLAVHRRRLRYWSGVPSLSGYGPTGANLSSGYMSEQYEIAASDATSIAAELDALGVKVQVVDIAATFRDRWDNPNAPERLMWPA
jgi:hypothetical protein